MKVEADDLGLTGLTIPNRSLTGLTVPNRSLTGLTVPTVSVDVKQHLKKNTGCIFIKIQTQKGSNERFFPLLFK